MRLDCSINDMVDTKWVSDANNNVVLKSVAQDSCLVMLTVSS